jgi:hypothetical protein
MFNGVTEEYEVYLWDYLGIGRVAVINNFMQPDIVIDLAGEEVKGMIQ